MKAPGNQHDLHESWLRAAVNLLRPYFVDIGYPLPEHIRTAIAFPSTGRKGKRLAECWHSTSSEDDSFEIFIRADLAEPIDVLGVLVKELVHSALPDGVGHGKEFKTAALKAGLQGPMRTAKPGILLQGRLLEMANTLGPLPHARLHIDQSPLTAIAPLAAVALDGPKKQRMRWLKAECRADGCDYLARITAKHVRGIGPPHCPKHGEMHVEFPPQDDEPDAIGEESVHTPPL